MMKVLGRATTYVNWIATLTPAQIDQLYREILLDHYHQSHTQNIDKSTDKR